MFLLQYYKSLCKVAGVFLFPRVCVGCKQEGEWLCIQCSTGLYLKKDFFIRSAQGALDGVIAVAQYDEKCIASLIKLLKYSGAHDVQIGLRRALQMYLNSFPLLPISADVIVPVPLHKRRLNERGFNQATVLAHLLAVELGVPVKEVLERRHYTKTQAKLTKAERLANVKEVFSLKNREGDLPKKIILVDDVFTTGSTMSECAGILKAGGVEKVWGFVFAVEE